MRRRCERRLHLIRPDAEELRREASRTVQGRVQRLTRLGRWVPDDGVSPGLAFTAGVIAYFPGPDCRCTDAERCIASMAMRHVSSHYRYGSANGVQVNVYV
jgi:hypothetical protein